MAYKWKATMYYSDEDTKKFLEDRALKPNGKKVSDSKYLYSLVNRTRLECLGENDTHSENRLLIDDFKGVVLHKPFKGFSQKRLNSDISLFFYEYKELVGFLSSDRVKVEAVRSIIQHVFSEDKDIRTELASNKAFLVLVVNKLTVYYCAHEYGISPSGFGGVLGMEVSPIYVDVNLWDKYSGKYYFDKTRYLKYAQISNCIMPGYKQFSKVHEMSTMDGNGGFFIPVGDTGKGFPSGLIGNVIVVGSEKRLGQNRVIIKEMTERRKNKYLSELKSGFYKKD